MGGVSKRLRQPTSHLSSLGSAGDDDEDDFEFSRNLPAPRALPVDAVSEAGPRDVPDAVVVPAFPFDGDGFGRVELQLMVQGEGLLAMAFTSAELLHAGLGEFQPWLRLPGSDLLRLLDDSVVDGLLIDPDPELVERLWTPEALATLKEINDGRL